MITVDQALWGLVIGTILPMIVALITNQMASGTFKSLTLLFLSAAVAVGQEVVEAGALDVKQTILKLALLFLVSVGIHYGLLRPSGVTGQNGYIQENLTGGIKGS